MDGGRAFWKESRWGEEWEEFPAKDAGSHARERHLGGCCKGATEFYDGVPVPSGEGGHSG